MFSLLLDESYDLTIDLDIFVSQDIAQYEPGEVSWLQSSSCLILTLLDQLGGPVGAFSAETCIC